jgi:PII-like signaling protein
MPLSRDAVLLRIYIGEDDKTDHKPLYEALVLKARELGLAGATVLRGPMGFGHSHAIHTAKIIDLSAKLPLVIEIVDAEDRVQALLAALGDMRDIGLVTTEKVQVVHYGGSDG